MTKALEYAKTIAALLGAVLTSVIVVLPDVPLWLVVVSTVVTAVAVFATPNATPVAKGEHVAE